MPIAGQNEDLGLVSAEAPVDSGDDLGMVPVDERIAPDTTALKNLVSQHVNKQGTPTEEANSFFKELQAGWQQSVAGLAVTNQQLPTTVLPEHASVAAHIVAGIGQFAGDAIPMAAGLIGAAPAGPIAQGAASFAVPAAVRKIYMDHYERGDITTAEELAGRTMSTLWEATKGAAVGAVTAGVGKAVAPLVEGMGLNAASKVATGKFVGPMPAPSVPTRLLEPMAEVAAMTTTAAALEGQLPNAKDFTVGALTIAAIKSIAHAPGAIGEIPGGTSKVASKLRQIYAETGMKPDQVAVDAQSDPVIHQELLMDNGEVPSAYKHLVEKVPEEPAVTMNDVMNEPPGTPTNRPTFQDQIGEPNKPKGEGYSVDRAIEDFQDRLNPFKSAQKVFDSMKENPEKLAAKNDPITLARMAADYNSKVKVFIEHGTLDANTLEKNGKSYNEIIKQVKDDRAGFEDYRIAKRTLDYEKRGLNSGFDLDKAKEIIRLGKDKFEKAHQEMVEFNFRVLKYAKDGGLLNAKDVINMAEKGENFASLRHIKEPDAISGTVRKGNVLRRVKGVEEGKQAKIQSPMLSDLESLQAIVRAVEKNRVSNALVEQAASAPGQAIIEKVTAPARAANVTAKEISKGLGDIEIDSDGFAVWRRHREQLKDNEFERYVGGEREVYRARPDVARAMKAVEGDPVPTNILIKLLRPAASAVRAGVTLAPGFQFFKNPFRDQLTAGAFTKGGSLPFVDVISAMGNLMRKDEHYYNWLKSGGGQSHFFEINENYLMRDVFKNNEKTGFLNATWNFINPLKNYQRWVAAGQMLESAPRLAEFKRVSKKSGVFEGGAAAREVTVDFSTIGRVVRGSGWNQITAFMNPAIQGLAKTTKAIKEDPVGVGSTAVALVTVPSILLWLKQKDDPRYQQIPRWKRDLTWPIITDSWHPVTPEDNAGAVPEYLKRINNGVMEINKGTIFYFPKPQEIGLLFGSLPERILESYFNENPRAFKGFAQSAFDVLVPPAMPNAVVPPLEHITDHLFFKGRKMLPIQLEGMAPQYQYQQYTSEVAKQLGKVIPALMNDPDAGVSPVVIDNYIKSWTGTVGQFVIQQVDKLSGPPKPEQDWADSAFVQSFITTHHRADAQQVNDFFDRANAAELKFKTIKTLTKKTGMATELESYMSSISAGEMVRFTGVKKAISENRKSIIAISEDPNMSPHEKRQLIDSLTYLIIGAATSAMKMVDALDKKNNEMEAIIKNSQVKK